MAKTPDTGTGWRERRAEKKREKALRTGPSPEKLRERPTDAERGDVKQAAERASGTIVAGGG